jgi:hypothetical protein
MPRTGSVYLSVNSWLERIIRCRVRQMTTRWPPDSPTAVAEDLEWGLLGEGPVLVLTNEPFDWEL